MPALSRLIVTLAMALCMSPPSPGLADGERPGEFDYYVMSLSWSPNWCALEGDARRSPQCRDDSGHGWVLHGLWPQYHRGWPSYCRTTEPQPSPAMTAAMADIMGTPGLAWHQWRKHGVCSGLSATAYFDLSRRAYASITRPAVFRKLDKPVRLPAGLIEEAFLKENDQLEPDMLTVTCRDGRIQEARICLSKDLTPVPCGRDVVRDCTLKDALFDPLR
jgi:ribonuclease T2